MANQLRMATVQTILTLRRRGWSFRRIARELGVHRETVARYVQLAEEGATGVHGPPMGGPPGDDLSKPANAPLGSSVDSGGPGSSVQPGLSGRISDCEPFREVIIEKLALGLSGVRIHQDLTTEHAARVSYDSIKRFCRRLQRRTPPPFRRMECAPGEEVQIDFGTGAPVVGPNGRRRRNLGERYCQILTGRQKAKTAFVFGLSRVNTMHSKLYHATQLPRLDFLPPRQILWMRIFQAAFFLSPSTN